MIIISKTFYTFERERVPMRHPAHVRPPSLLGRPNNDIDIAPRAPHTLSWDLQTCDAYIQVGLEKRVPIQFDLEDLESITTYQIISFLNTEAVSVQLPDLPGASEAKHQQQAVVKTTTHCFTFRPIISTLSILISWNPLTSKQNTCPFWSVDRSSENLALNNQHHPSALNLVESSWGDHFPGQSHMLESFLGPFL